MEEFTEQDLSYVLKSLDSYVPLYRGEELKVELVLDRVKAALAQYIGQTINDELHDKIRISMYKAIDAAFEEMVYY